MRQERDKKETQIGHLYKKPSIYIKYICDPPQIMCPIFKLYLIYYKSII